MIIIRKHRWVLNVALVPPIDRVMGTLKPCLVPSIEIPYGVFWEDLVLFTLFSVFVFWVKQKQLLLRLTLLLCHHRIDRPPNNGGFFSFSSLLFFPFLFDSSHLSLFLCANSFEREFREQTEHISVLPLVEASKIAKFRKHTQFCLIRELSPSTSDLVRLRLGPILSYIIQLNDI